MKTAILVGCGSMAAGWLDAISGHERLCEEFRIVGLVDLDVDRAKAFADAQKLSHVPVGSDLTEMLASVAPDCVFDVAVPSARFDIVSTALKHGCHVLSEKPMATNMEEAHALCALADAKSLVHAIVQNRRFNAGVRRVRKFIASGEIGELTQLHADFFVGAHFGGFREDMDHVLLLDMAIHTFDAARFMADAVPVNVFCKETNPKGSWYRTGAAATALFDFSNQVEFSYRGSWCAEGANTSWESQWRVVGTKGTLMWDGADAFSATRVVGDDGFFHALESVNVSEDVNADEIAGHASVLLSFLEAMKTGEPPETASADNLHSLAMVMGAIKSVRSGQTVSIGSEF